jgi:hypothetical protein
MTMSTRIEHAPVAEPWSPNGPEASACVAPSDVATALLQCIVHARGAQQETARDDIEHAHELLERARREMREALERAERAERNGDFWGDLGAIVGGDVAAVAGIVAAASLAVATGGAGAPAIVAMAAAGLSIGAKAGQELGLDPRVVAALAATGAALGLFAGNAASAGSAWTTVAHAASGVQGGAAAVGGGATIVEGQYRSDALEERADARAAQARQHDAWLRFDVAIAELERAARDVSHAKERAAGVVETESAGHEAMLSRMGAA